MKIMSCCGVLLCLCGGVEGWIGDGMMNVLTGVSVPGFDL